MKVSSASSPLQSGALNSLNTSLWKHHWSFEHNTILLFIMTSPELIFDSVTRLSKWWRDVTRAGDEFEMRARPRRSAARESVSGARRGRTLRLYLECNLPRSLRHAHVFSYTPVRLVSSPLWMVVMLCSCAQ